MRMLRFGTGFSENEYDGIRDRFGSLWQRLKSFEPGQVDMELSVKDRDDKEQRVTLELWAPGWPKLVATSTRTDLDHALSEVRDDMIRQVDDTKTRREPANNRQLR